MGLGQEGRKEAKTLTMLRGGTKKEIMKEARHKRRNKPIIN